ncbi:YncE family protein [Ferruginibacter sp. HRS2-29]|uniref:YncE family protein n=1 Tax=Ferruginibacter sp. HRS2-29 TaxID=2487334 RepID=UPI0020CF3A03|nr:YncE family protein [Ferruginibacter sp. HRS2-29]MCP9750382.1 YncE family protein [Ferruginibacter sp. HRS2-29]
MKRNLIKWLLPAIVIFSACSKDDVAPTPPVLSPATGVYVLSEGNIGAGNSKLGFYTFNPVLYTGDYFVQQNPGQTGLGDTGNDAVFYGSKMYIVMNFSSEVVVLNASTGVFLKRITFGTGAGKQNPRYALGAKGKVYVTSTNDNKVSIIDTTSLTISGSINVGANPEGMAVVGNNLYVANSGGYNLVPDSTVSVIDLNTNAEIKKITIGTRNPQRIEANSAGDLYVSGYGNFTTIPASVSVINSSTNTVASEMGAAYSYAFLRISNDLAYFYNNYGGAGTAKVYNTISKTVVRNEFVTDGTVIDNPYGLNVDEQNGDVYITDAKNFSSAGSVTCFDKDGKKKFSFATTAGVSPNKVLFKR